MIPGRHRWDGWCRSSASRTCFGSFVCRTRGTGVPFYAPVLIAASQEHADKNHSTLLAFLFLLHPRLQVVRSCNDGRRKRQSTFVVGETQPNNARASTCEACFC
ncbi:unnamed protein product, partial [Scytosiphon promiscuus]